MFDSRVPAGYAAHNVSNLHKNREIEKLFHWLWAFFVVSNISKFVPCRVILKTGWNFLISWTIYLYFRPYRAVKYIRVIGSFASSLQLLDKYSSAQPPRLIHLPAKLNKAADISSSSLIFTSRKGHFIFLLCGFESSLGQSSFLCLA